MLSFWGGKKNQVLRGTDSSSNCLSNITPREQPLGAFQTTHTEGLIFAFQTQAFYVFPLSLMSHVSAAVLSPLSHMLEQQTVPPGVP